MATMRMLYLGVLEHGVLTGEFTWHYGSVEVKETAKQYRMTEEADKATWYSSYEGQTFSKSDLSFMGNSMGYRGLFSLEDNEEAIMDSIRADLLEEKEYLEDCYSRAVKKGRSGSRLKLHIEEINRALSVLG
ncbi:hypothetical protein [Streptococcus oriscaviae]|uniref:Phage protein n=1 Tax=Streptococcus oriscaviae TaxID=2781599 RepID=A0ABX7YJU5_9STRE|nr:hypothetical protein [Streptococcus oriscaviae]QUE53569.1 hypothetical protein INT76_06810 [Streptococcus oriscaviae]